MRVEVVVRDVVDDLWAWAEARAAELGLEPGAYLGRLIDQDRRRVIGAPRLDPRTRLVGVHGGASHQPVARNVAEVARLVDAEPGAVSQWGAPSAGYHVFPPSGRGNRREYGDADVLCAAIAREAQVARMLDRIPLDVFAQVRARYPVVRDLYVVIGAHASALINLNRLVPTVRESGSVLVLSLEGLELRWRAKLAA